MNNVDLHGKEPMRDKVTSMLKKTLTAQVESSTGNTIVAKLTTDSVDRDGEVLVPQGMNAKDYEKNPVLFYNHEYDQPIGKVTNIKRVDRAVMGNLEFAQRPKDFIGDFFPSFVEALVKQGIVKGVSVGFVPEQGGARVASKADRSKFGDGIKKVFNKWKLLEVSIAPLPANQDALITAVGKGIVTTAQVKKFCNLEVEASMPEVKIKSTHRIKLTRPVDTKALIDNAVKRQIAKQSGKLFM